MNYKFIVVIAPLLTNLAPSWKQLFHTQIFAHNFEHGALWYFKDARYFLQLLFTMGHNDFYIILNVYGHKHFLWRTERSASSTVFRTRLKSAYRKPRSTFIYCWAWTKTKSSIINVIKILDASFGGSQHSIGGIICMLISGLNNPCNKLFKKFVTFSCKLNYILLSKNWISCKFSFQFVI